jgi:hypothetical protein
MVWFFERAQEVTRLETTFDNDTKEYILVVESNGTPRTERFPTQQAFQARLTNLEEQLRAQKWVQRGDVEILEDGWRGPTSRTH